MSRKHSTALGFGAAISGAAVAGFISMGTAHADADFYEDVFGAPGTSGLALGQAADNVALDQAMFASNPGNATAVDILGDSFENSGTAHPLEQLFFGLDPSAYQVQFDPDITGYLTGANAGGYLVPDDFLGYLGTTLDADLLNPTGLGPLLLGPLIDVLLGFPASP
ncbi:hypothetical protein [Mycobacterium sp.]|uniref:hypothetical protein n=1 Tax=Mycobacterium sp. TaxID=1785 RepID=UPI003C77C4E1